MAVTRVLPASEEGARGERRGRGQARKHLGIEALVSLGQRGGTRAVGEDSQKMRIFRRFFSSFPFVSYFVIANRYGSVFRTMTQESGQIAPSFFSFLPPGRPL